MQFELKNKVTLTGMKPETDKAIRQQLTIPNPAFAEAERMGKWTGNISRTLKFYKKTPTGIECPKGAAQMIYNEYRNHHSENITVVKNVRTLVPVSFNFKSKLRPLQTQAVKGCSQRSIGLLLSPTGAGKTVMALYLIAYRKQPVLIVVHTKELLKQWIERICTFLGILAADVGIVGDGKFRIGNKITVGMVQTLSKRAAEVAPHIGHLILDECHHAPANQYIKTIEQFDCKYLLGLTATPYRRDGLEQAIQWYLGPITGWIEKQELVDAGDLCKGEVVFFQTGYESSYDDQLTNPYTRALSELTQDLDRNKLICRTINKYHGTGITLVLSDRKKHCESLAGILKEEHGLQAAVLTGKTLAKEREQIIQDLRSGKCRFLVATGSLIGEGFDLPEISNLALATPIKSSGRLIQYVGRALRPAPGKNKAVILDFVDDHGVFKASAKTRWSVYQQQGIAVAVG